MEHLRMQKFHFSVGATGLIIFKRGIFFVFENKAMLGLHRRVKGCRPCGSFESASRMAGQRKIEAKKARGGSRAVMVVV